VPRSPSSSIPPVVSTTRRLSAASAAVVDSIRTAALELAATRKYEEISMIEVAERSGVSRTTLYKHYQSKDHLLIDVLRSIWPTDIPVPDDGSAQARVTAYALGLLDFWSARRNLLGSMVRATVTADIDAFHTFDSEPMVTSVETLLAEADVPDERRELITLALLHVMGGQFISLSRGVDPAVVRDQTIGLIDVVLAPIGSRPSHR
jgi:AcrR family transcriptional regulator